MFWNLFKKENKEKENLEVEKIKVFDEKLNEEVLVEKKSWINSFLLPKMKENINNTENLYNLLLIGLGYNIYQEILEYSLILKDKEYSSLRSIEVISEIYFYSSAYGELLELIDKYKNENTLSASLYYYFALSHLYNDLDIEYEELIIEAIKKYPNNTKLIKELNQIIESKQDNEKIDIMKNLSMINGAYKICMIFAEIEYKNSRYKSANEYILKAILYSKNKVEILNKIANILFEYNQFMEYENHILTKFDINEKNITFCLMNLQFYYLMMRYEDGLLLLKQMYDLKLYTNKILDKLVFYENSFLNMKLKTENKLTYDRIENEIEDGEIQYFNILNPLYYYILDRNPKFEISKDSDENIMFLPICLENLNPISKELKKYLNVIPIILLERIYKYTNIKFQATYNKNDVLFINKKGNYDIEFFKMIYRSNPKLKYIISGVLREEKSGMFLTIYKYDTEKNEIKDLVSEASLNEIDPYLISKILKSITNDFQINLRVEDFEIDLNDIKNTEINLNLFFDFDKSNKFRYWSMINQLEYYINDTRNEINILRALSIIKIMKLYKMNFDSKYRNILYEINARLNNDKDITKIIKNIFDEEE